LGENPFLARSGALRPCAAGNDVLARKGVVAKTFVNDSLSMLNRTWATLQKNGLTAKKGLFSGVLAGKWEVGRGKKAL
jgi:hypothetical protein